MQILPLYTVNVEPRFVEDYGLYIIVYINKYTCYHHLTFQHILDEYGVVSRLSCTS